MYNMSHGFDLVVFCGIVLYIYEEEDWTAWRARVEWVLRFGKRRGNGG